MARHLVTGGAGFIGSQVARALIDRGHEVVVVDNLTTGYRENVPTKALFIERACQDDSLYQALGSQTFDAVLHIAGQSSGEVSFEDPVYDLRTNTESTLRLVQHALSNGCTRFVYASSMSVYGDKADRPVKEDEPPKPLSFYGVGKLASEHYLRIYEAQGLRPTSLRLFNVYGPGQNLANMRQGMISIYLAQMLRDDKVLVKGGLDRFRDFVYIEDVVEAFLACLQNERSIGQILNVGTGQRVTVGQLLELMFEVYGRRLPVTLGEGTPGDQFGIRANTSLFEGTMGFKAGTGLTTGLENMFRWAKSPV